MKPRLIRALECEDGQDLIEYLAADRDHYGRKSGGYCRDRRKDRAVLHGFGHRDALTWA